MDLSSELESLKRQLQEELEAASDLKENEALRVRFLGKKGLVAKLMPLLKSASPEERPLLGQKINEIKDFALQQINEQKERLERREMDARLACETQDLTLPGIPLFAGKEHVIAKMMRHATSVLTGIGFSVQLGPDIESDYYNFEALNFGKDHPARDMQDTFYLDPETVLRTHTSNTQVRVMEASRPPIRVMAPGKCYRNEDVNPRSHVAFHQIEGLYIDQHVTFADLFATLRQVFTQIMEDDQLEMRFRPSYFPFVEPGVEVDISCLICKGKGCSVCKQSGWLEVAGAGLVHPEVLKSGGLDPEEVSGYAFGFGIERLAILRYGIPDIRLFFENQLHFLSQFSS